MITPPRTGGPGHSDDNIEARLHEYFRKTNRLIPTSPDDVEAMERWIAERDIEVPKELLRRQGCSLTSNQHNARALKCPEQSSEVERDLARAAREGGKPISSEVEERMKRDREQKEREKKGDE